MAPVEFGVAVGSYTAGVPEPKRLAEFAVRAETVGFDSIQVGDHIQWHAPILEPTTLMAALAAVTRSIRLASSVIILPLRDPVLLAKTIASLDVLSGGRVILGVGVGGDYPPEYAAMRVPLAERGSRANESLEIIRGLLERQRFSYRGRHFAFEDVAIDPRPVQTPLPIWVGGTSEPALERAARHAHGWLGAFASERKFQRLAADLRERLAAAGRSPGGFTFGTVVFVNVDPDPALARAEAIAYVDRVYRLPGASVVERWAAVGPIEACVERVCAYVAAGVEYVVLSPLCRHADWARQLDAYGEIIARVRAG